MSAFSLTPDWGRGQLHARKVQRGFNFFSLEEYTGYLCRVVCNIMVYYQGYCWETVENSQPFYFTNKFCKVGCKVLTFRSSDRYSMGDLYTNSHILPLV